MARIKTSIPYVPVFLGLPSAPLKLVKFVRRKTLVLLWGLLGTLFGAACVFARASGSIFWVNTADSWVLWALLLAAASLSTQNMWVNVVAIATTGLSALCAYYALKAHLALGFSHQADRGFDVYLQQDNLLHWLFVVLASAVPAGLLGAKMHSLLRKKGNQSAD